MEPFVQPQIYGLGAAGVPAVRRKAAKKPALPAARTPEGDTPFDLVNGWAEWMLQQTGIGVPKVMRDRLMHEVKDLIHDRYGSSDLKWALAIWSTKLAKNANTSPKELPTIAWKYRMDTSQEAKVWREKMRQSASEMSRGGISPSALANSPAEEKTAKTVHAANAWAQRRIAEENRK